MEIIKEQLGDKDGHGSVREKDEAVVASLSKISGAKGANVERPSAGAEGEAIGRAWKSAMNGSFEYSIGVLAL